MFKKFIANIKLLEEKREKLREKLLVWQKSERERIEKERREEYGPNGQQLFEIKTGSWTARNGEEIKSHTAKVTAKGCIRLCEAWEKSQGLVVAMGFPIVAFLAQKGVGGILPSLKSREFRQYDFNRPTIISDEAA